MSSLSENGSPPDQVPKKKRKLNLIPKQAEKPRCNSSPKVQEITKIPTRKKASKKSDDITEPTRKKASKKSDDITEQTQKPANYIEPAPDPYAETPEKPRISEIGNFETPGKDMPLAPTSPVLQAPIPHESENVPPEAEATQPPPVLQAQPPATPPPQPQPEQHRMSPEQPAVPLVDGDIMDQILPIMEEAKKPDDTENKIKGKIVQLDAIGRKITAQIEKFKSTKYAKGFQHLYSTYIDQIDTLKKILKDNQQTKAAEKIKTRFNKQRDEINDLVFSDETNTSLETIKHKIGELEMFVDTVTESALKSELSYDLKSVKDDWQSIIDSKTALEKLEGDEKTAFEEIMKTYKQGDLESALTQITIIKGNKITEQLNKKLVALSSQISKQVANQTKDDWDDKQRELMVQAQYNNMKNTLNLKMAELNKLIHEEIESVKNNKKVKIGETEYSIDNAVSRIQNQVTEYMKEMIEYVAVRITKEDEKKSLIASLSSQAKALRNYVYSAIVDKFSNTTRENTSYAVDTAIDNVENLMKTIDFDALFKPNGTDLNETVSTSLKDQIAVLENNINIVIDALKKEKDNLGEQAKTVDSLLKDATDNNKTDLTFKLSQNKDDITSRLAINEERQRKYASYKELAKAKLGLKFINEKPKIMTAFNNQDYIKKFDTNAETIRQELLSGKITDEKANSNNIDLLNTFIGTLQAQASQRELRGLAKQVDADIAEYTNEYVKELTMKKLDVAHELLGNLLKTTNKRILESLKARMATSTAALTECQNIISTCKIPEVATYYLNKMIEDLTFITTEANLVFGQLDENISLQQSLPTTTVDESIIEATDTKEKKQGLKAQFSDFAKNVGDIKTRYTTTIINMETTYKNAFTNFKASEWKIVKDMANKVRRFSMDTDNIAEDKTRFTLYSNFNDLSNMKSNDPALSCDALLEIANYAKNFRIMPIILVRATIDAPQAIISATLTTINDAIAAASKTNHELFNKHQTVFNKLARFKINYQKTISTIKSQDYKLADADKNMRRIMEQMQTDATSLDTTLNEYRAEKDKDYLANYIKSLNIEILNRYTKMKINTIEKCEDALKDQLSKGISEIFRYIKAGTKTSAS